ncbi:PrsW family intramembrane metalloprotease [Halobacteriales archaeon QS_1_68_20]|nr:MAG: PrsW family intramembrane metalloprotease [Halobacteriales archaeon QS_1_68_20]
MSERRDPVERGADDSRDLYDVATWERRTAVDAIAVFVYGLVGFLTRAAVVGLALAIFLAIIVQGGLALVLEDPLILVLVAFSALPALALAWYVRRADATRAEPLWLLVATFLLGVLFATFAAVLNTLVMPLFAGLGALALPLFFLLVVGPVEETVKLLAVRLYAFRSSRFDAVVDGAVYGAFAGLGFATIENFIYITRIVGQSGELAIVGAGGGIATVRALAGPGHVIYSAIAGYYLGLAKFNRRNRGPIVVKGLLIAVLVHAGYNVLSGVAPGALAALVPGVGTFAAFVVFILVYDGVFAYYLYRKLRRYGEAFRAVRGRRGDRDPASELTEFDP